MLDLLFHRRVRPEVRTVAPSVRVGLLSRLAALLGAQSEDGAAIVMAMKETRRPADWIELTKRK